MKICKASYMDDGVTIAGVLIEKFLRKPVFYAADPSCGWNSQVITKAEQSKVVKWISNPKTGTSRCFCNTEGTAQSSDDMYRKAIQATIDSGLADKILSSEKAQSLNTSNSDQDKTDKMELIEAPKGTRSWRHTIKYLVCSDCYELILEADSWPCGYVVSRDPSVFPKYIGIWESSGKVFIPERPQRW